MVVEPVLSVGQAAEPRVALVEQVKHLRCKQAAHKRMVAVAAAMARPRVRAALVVAVLRYLEQRAQPLLLTRAVEVAALTTMVVLPLLVVLVAQGSSWYGRSSVALLRVLLRRVAQKPHTRVTERTVSLVSPTRFTHLLLLVR